MQRWLQRSELAFDVAPFVPGNGFAGGLQPLLNRAARPAGALRDLAEGELVAQLHAPDLANHGHGDRLVSPC